jgi:hypothetical protein
MKIFISYPTIQAMEESALESLERHFISTLQLSEVSGISIARTRYLLKQLPYPAEDGDDAPLGALAQLRYLHLLYCMTETENRTIADIRKEFERPTTREAVRRLVSTPPMAKVLNMGAHAYDHNFITLYDYLASRLGEIMLVLVLGSIPSDVYIVIGMKTSDRVGHDNVVFHGADMLNDLLLSLDQSLVIHTDSTATVIASVETRFIIEGQYELVKLLPDHALYAIYPTELSGTYRSRLEAENLVANRAENSKEAVRKKVLRIFTNWLTELVQRRLAMPVFSNFTSIARTNTQGKIQRLQSFLDFIVEMFKQEGVPQFYFATFLTPTGDHHLARHTQSLATLASSKGSPYYQQSITVHPDSSALSIEAYTLGQTVTPGIYARVHGLETDTVTGIALPAVLDKRVEGILYIACNQEVDFNETDDLVLSLLAHLSAAIMSSSPLAGDIATTLARLVNEPHIAHAPFANFLSRSRLLRALDAICQAVKDAHNPKTFTIICVDINRITQTLEHYRLSTADEVDRFCAEVGLNLHSLLKMHLNVKGLQAKSYPKPYHDYIDRYFYIFDDAINEGELKDALAKVCDFVDQTPYNNQIYYTLRIAGLVVSAQLGDFFLSKGEVIYQQIAGKLLGSALQVWQEERNKLTPQNTHDDYRRSIAKSVFYVHTEA